MKRMTTIICTIILLTTGKNINAQTADEMKAYMDFVTPGAMHKWLASFDGTWEAYAVSYMNPAKPDTSKLIQTYSMMLNGLYQEAKITGEMMGMPFEGRSWSGFDNAKKKFVMTWVDNVSSGTTYLTGDYDAATKTLNLKGTQTNPTNGKDMNIREVLKVIDNNTYILIMYGDGPDGKEIKFMEGTFKRKK